MIKSKQVRVFLSSTFKDMQQERDALVKLFRQLSLEGRKKGLNITLLDLRWGISNDQKRNGLVISTCLQEIDNSRPFFIGLIGNRYGWVPSKEEMEENPELLSKFPKIKEYASKGMSITEIEMRHGVLDSPSSNRAIFLRKRNLIPEGENHLTLIKDISDSSMTELYDYGSIEELSNIVRSEFLKLITNEIEESESKDFKKNKISQERILQEKAEDYIDFQGYKDKLMDWFEGEEKTLVVSGERGVGKSSLIASWIEENRNRFENVIHYFIGEGDEEENPRDIQRYIIDNIEEIFGISVIDKNSLEDDYDVELDVTLEKVSEKGEKLLLIIDGLDHIVSEGLNRMMLWLPELPANIKLLVTTTTGDLSYHSLTETKKFPELEIKKFSTEETVHAINKYLLNYGKTLEDLYVLKLAENPVYHKGSFMKIMLDDLIAYGSFEDLPKQIIKYGDVINEQSFFDKAIERAEEFYGEEKVRTLLLLLTATKNGLAENDIVEILGMEPLEWSEIFCGLRNYLMFSDGKIILKYSELIDVIIDRYEKENSALIISLRKKILNLLKERKEEYDESAYQAFNLEEWEILHATIRPFEIMKDLIVRSEVQMQAYWNSLSDQGYSFREYLEDLPNINREELEDIYDLLIIFIELDLNDYQLAVDIHKAYIDILGDSEEDMKLKGRLNLYIARLYTKHMDAETAKNYLEKAKQIFEKYCTEKDYEWGIYYFDLGNNLSQLSEHEKALETHRKALQYEIENDDSEETEQWAYLNRIGIDLMNLNRYEEAIEVFEKALKLVTERQTSVTLEPSQIINNIGLCFYELENYDKAEQYIEKAVTQMLPMFSALNMELFEPITNLGLVYLRNNKLDEARDSFYTGLEILEKTYSDSEMPLFFSFIYESLGEIEYEAENHNQAEEWFLKAIRTPDYNLHIGKAYINIAELYLEQEEWETAIEVYEELAKRTKSIFDGPNSDTALAYSNMGEIYLDHEKFKKARKEYEKALKIYRQIGDEESAQEIQDILNNL